MASLRLSLSCKSLPFPQKQSISHRSFPKNLVKPTASSFPNSSFPGFNLAQNHFFRVQASSNGAKDADDYIDLVNVELEKVHSDVSRALDLLLSARKEVFEVTAFLFSLTVVMGSSFHDPNPKAISLVASQVFGPYNFFRLPYEPSLPLNVRSRSLSLDGARDDPRALKAAGALSECYNLLKFAEDEAGELIIGYNLAKTGLQRMTAEGEEMRKSQQHLDEDKAKALREIDEQLFVLEMQFKVAVESYELMIKGFKAFKGCLGVIDAWQVKVWEKNFGGD